MLDQAPGTSAAGEGSEGGGGNGVLIGVGVVLLLGAAGGILYWVTRAPEQTKVTTVSSTSVTATADPTIELPSIDPIVDSGIDTGAEDVGADAKKVANAGGGGCPAVCSGTITPAIREAVAARAGTAKQCYKTALEGNEGLAGDMSVLVRVGADGSACSVSISSDTTGSSRLQQCVRQKMVAGYPHPTGGCVDVRVPIHFAPKT